MFHLGEADTNKALKHQSRVPGHISNEGAQGAEKTDFTPPYRALSINADFPEGQAVLCLKGMCVLHEDCCDKITGICWNWRENGENHSQIICHL